MGPKNYPGTVKGHKMGSEIWELFKKEIPAKLEQTDLANYMAVPGRWSKPLSEAVRGCLDSLARSRSEVCIYSSRQNREFLVDAIICKSQGELDDQNLRENRDHKRPVSFPLGQISYAVEWEWDTGKDAVHFATRDVPKLKYLEAINKVIIYSKVNDGIDISRKIIKEILTKTLLSDNCVTIIEFERNNQYDKKRLCMNFVCNKTYTTEESISVFPLGTNKGTGTKLR